MHRRTQFLSLFAVAALPLFAVAKDAHAQYRVRWVPGGYYAPPPCYYSYCPPPPPPPCQPQCYEQQQPVYQAPQPAPQPAPTYAPPSYAQPVAVVQTTPENAVPRWAVGAFTGGLTQSDDVRGQDVGLLGRFRLGEHFQLEAELSLARLEEGDREDHRIGAGLIYDLTPERTLSPYLLGAVGFGSADISRDELTATQGYGEVGGGMHLYVTKNLVLGADLRAGLRRLTPDEEASREMLEPNEQYVRARVAAFLFF